MEQPVFTYFEMNVIGEEKAVEAFLEKLQQRGIFKFAMKQRTSGELENGTPIVEQLCSGTLKGPIGQTLKELSGEMGVIAEYYGRDDISKAEEHIVVDRGSFFLDSREKLEPVNVGEMTPEEFQEFLDWEDLTEEEVRAQAVDGIYYTGGKENFMQMSPHLSWYLNQEPREIYEYDSSYGGKLFVTTEMGIYQYGDNLHLDMGAYDEDLGALDNYGDITVNIAPLPYLMAAIDTNNNGKNIVSMLVKNGFGEPTGQTLLSGFCEYPVFRFNEEKLMALFPEKMKEYARLKGVVLKKPSLESQISGAKAKTDKASGKGGRKGPEGPTGR